MGILNIMRPKELAEELGVTAMQVGRVRSRLGLPKGELSEAEADMVRSEFGENVEDIGPKFCMGKVKFAQRGSRQVGVRLEDGSLVRAFIPLGTDCTEMLEKKLKWEYIDYEGERYYRHAGLSAKTWAAMSRQIKNI
jgi:hypothetical protein